MGVLPLQFKDGESAESHGITGSEKFNISGIVDGLKPLSEIIVEISNDFGEKKSINVLCRLDSIVEVEYFYNGGILQTVLRQMVKSN